MAADERECSCFSLTHLALLYCTLIESRWIIPRARYRVIYCRIYNVSHFVSVNCLNFAIIICRCFHFFRHDRNNPAFAVNRLSMYSFSCGFFCSLFFAVYIYLRRALVQSCRIRRIASIYANTYSKIFVTS